MRVLKFWRQKVPKRYWGLKNEDPNNFGSKKILVQNPKIAGITAGA